MSMNENEKELLGSIRRIEEWNGKEIHYEPVLGGKTNNNWKVKIDENKYFVKIPGKEQKLLLIEKTVMPQT